MSLAELQSLREAGLLGELELQFAALMARLAGAESRELALAAALVSQAAAEGHVCLALDQIGSSNVRWLTWKEMAVGALNEADSSAGVTTPDGNNTLNQSGAVYIYTRSGSTWSFQQYIKAINPGLQDMFGHQVAGRQQA